MNKIEKLELRHLCGYLPYGLKCHCMGLWTDDESQNPVTVEVVGANLDHVEIHEIGRSVTEEYDYCDVLPLLLPLSALTEPLPDGTVPIVELAKIAYPKSDTIKLDIEDGTAVIDSAENYRFEYKNGSFECYYLKYSPRVENCFVPNQIQLFEYLYANHFDVYGLIPAGLAIDKTIQL